MSKNRFWINNYIYVDMKSFAEKMLHVGPYYSLLFDFLSQIVHI